MVALCGSCTSIRPSLPGAHHLTSRLPSGPRTWCNPLFPPPPPITVIPLTDAFYNHAGCYHFTFYTDDGATGSPCQSATPVWFTL